MQTTYNGYKYKENEPSTAAATTTTTKTTTTTTSSGTQSYQIRTNIGVIPLVWSTFVPGVVAAVVPLLHHRLLHF